MIPPFHLARNVSFFFTILYGFIIRYPKGKEHLTKIPAEPWHIRYVTRSLALCLTLTGQVLEEYYHTISF